MMPERAFGRAPRVATAGRRCVRQFISHARSPFERTPCRIPRTGRKEYGRVLAACPPFRLGGLPHGLGGGALHEPVFIQRYWFFVRFCGHQTWGQNNLDLNVLITIGRQMTQPRFWILMRRIVLLLFLRPCDIRYFANLYGRRPSYGAKIRFF